jgi:hypothetical protein
LTNIRYEIFPQMEYYDNMPAGITVPYAMLAGPSNVSSKEINTDKFGFRKSVDGNKSYSVEEIGNYEEVNIVIGGSTVFGVGSTNDDKTIASLLTQRTNEVWLNMGIRGAVSLSEYIHLIRFVHKAKKIKKIYFFSGVNDIYVNLMCDNESLFDHTFIDPLWNQSLKDRLCGKFASIFYGVEPTELVDITNKQRLFYPFVSKNQNKKIVSLNEQTEIIIDQYKRNMLLYSALMKTMDIDISFVFQPMAHWTKKRLTHQEQEVFNYLDKLQIGSKWEANKDKLSHELYDQLNDRMRDISESNGIKYVDSNPFFKDDLTYFVDFVHLTDEGNKKAVELILDEMYDN